MVVFLNYIPAVKILSHVILMFALFCYSTMECTCHRKIYDSYDGSYSPSPVKTVLQEIMQMLQVFFLQYLQGLALNLAQILQVLLSTDIVYLDFKKAFDSVLHQRLLIKLKGYGMTNKCLNWISSFLSVQHQRVVVKGEMFK